MKEFRSPVIHAGAIILAEQELPTVPLVGINQSTGVKAS